MSREIHPTLSEGIAGMWHYHYAPKGRPNESLCGAQAMLTGVPAHTWGFKPDHMPTSYCSTCATLRAKRED